MSASVSTTTWWSRPFGSASSDRVIMRGITATSATRVTFEAAVQTLQETTMKALDEFVAAVRSLPSVEYVDAEVAGTYVHLMTYMSESTSEERAAVYDVELEVADRYQGLHFEFDVYDRRGHPMQEVDEVSPYFRPIRKLPDVVHADQVQ